MKNVLLSVAFSILLPCSPLFAQWMNLNANLPGNLKGVSFSSASTGVVCGTAGLFYTSNGGFNWQRVNPTGVPADTMVFHYTSFRAIVYIATTTTWIAVGRDTVQNKAVIFRINASGTICELKYTGTTATDLSDVRKVQTYAVTVGKSGLALMSGDGGLTWATLPNFSSGNDLYSLTNNGSTVTIIGNGVAYKSTNFPSASWAAYTGVPTMNRIAYGPSVCGVGAGAYYSSNYGASWNSITAYHNYPINGRAVFFRSFNDGSIATDHGVYISVSGISTWEFQPSTAGYSLNDLFFLSGTGYAVGDNGVVLTTSNSGGTGLPYVNYTSQHGACVDSTIQFTNVSPTNFSYTYNWKNNGATFATTYNSFYTFNTTGNYDIRLVGTHNSLRDSVSYTMPIVTLPDLNKTYSVSDTLLCKSGSSTITVHNSDAGFIYRLYKLSPFGLVDQVTGSGGDIDLHTGTITDSTMYRVKVLYSSVDCGGFLPDTILVGVEKTKAAFHCQLINAEISEGISFVENCRQAAYFSWSFGTNATPSTSVAADPSGITYSNTGATQVTLIATSSHGCVDTVTGSGATIFDNTVPALNTSCWAINLDGQNPGFTYELEAGYDLSSDERGNLLVGGRFTNAVFTSRAGANYGRTTDNGLFLADYNSNGVLRWLVHGGEAGDLNRITEVERAADGSIYATGFGSGTCWVHSNRGDSVDIGAGSYIFHFDSLGGLIWYCKFPNIQQEVLPMKVDTAGNCYVTGNQKPTSFYSSVSGTQALSLGSTRSFIAKINSNGTLGWMTTTDNSSSYYTGITDIAIDKTGHIYLTGHYSAALTFNSVASASIIAPAAGQGCDIFVAKYTTGGNVVWVKHAGTAASGYTFDTGFCIEADESGNTYVGGQVDSYYQGMYVEFPGQNNTIVQAPVGQLFYASFDSAGSLRWAEGTGYSNDGRSTALALGKHHEVLGSAWLYSPSALNAAFVSSNNTYTTFPINNGSFYFTVYDTSGVLQLVNTETGLVPTGQATDAEAWGIDNDTAGNIYVAGDIWPYNGNPYYTIADTTLLLNHQDAFIAKIGAGCQVPNTFSTVITSAAGLQDEVPSVTIYPVPSKGDIRINSSAVIQQVEVTDMLGRTTTTYPCNSRSFECTITQAGVYFLRVHTDQGMVIRKIVVEQ